MTIHAMIIEHLDLSRFQRVALCVERQLGVVQRHRDPRTRPDAEHQLQRNKNDPPTVGPVPHAGEAARADG